MKNYNVEQLYEEYCDENEVQFSSGDILGYNPVVSDVEEEAGSRHGNSLTKSRWSKLVLFPKYYFGPIWTSVINGQSSLILKIKTIPINWGKRHFRLKLLILPQFHVWNFKKAYCKNNVIKSLLYILNFFDEFKLHNLLLEGCPGYNIRVLNQTNFIHILILNFDDIIVFRLVKCEIFLTSYEQILVQWCSFNEKVFLTLYYFLSCSHLYNLYIIMASLDDHYTDKGQIKSKGHLEKPELSLIS